MKLDSAILRKFIHGDFLTTEEKSSVEAYKTSLSDLQRFRWYTTPEVCYELVRALKWHETTFHNILEKKQPIRWLNVGSISFLLREFLIYEFLKRPYTLHRSLAVYNKLPAFPTGGGRGDYIRKVWTNENDEYVNHILEFNLGIDIDCKTFDQGYKWAKKLVKLFYEYNVQHSIWFSGKKGWHLVIEKIPFMRSPSEKYALCKDILTDLENHLNISLDTMMASPTAYMKCPWSIDPRTNLVIRPLSPEEFKHFDKDMLNMEKILEKPWEIRRRGMVLHNTGDMRKLIEAI